MRKGLGKGLSALISGSEEEYANATRVSDNYLAVSDGDKSQEVSIDKIYPNKNQPRKVFDDLALNELTQSIINYGVITPIIVVKDNDNYMIIAGERRYKAASRAGLKTIPVIIRDYSQKEVSEISLIDNLQREDLNPVEKALAIKGLINEFKFTQEEVALKISKPRTTVANLLRLLTLPNDVLSLLANGGLTEGHGKCLVAIDNKELQTELAKKASNDKLSVRELEKQIKAYKNRTHKTTTPTFMPIELKDLVSKMQAAFGTKVTALGTDKKGRLIIEYYSRDDLDRILEIVNS